MSTTPSSPLPEGPRESGDRPVRRDARRNREKLIAAAQAVFVTAEAPVALEAIARQAGVGIGTLYRHFPTREDLVDAVYAAELDEVTASVSPLLEQFPADRALRAWLGRYATFIATKRGMMETLRAGFASGRVDPSSRERVTATIGTFLTHGTADGTLRADVDPDDVTAMLIGVFHTIRVGGSQEQTGRLLDLLVDALHPRTDAPDD
ncbi:TetR/AcrR family transcriptional regulator [Streptomyces sp. T028]|uniref:TetR/AcrR family transcriptional regulator n=1 Tax=Streptomyces sp. T028 TaxID=3394379 RepID=UPI003A8562D3